MARQQRCSNHVQEDACSREVCFELFLLQQAGPRLGCNSSQDLLQLEICFGATRSGAGSYSPTHHKVTAIYLSNSLPQSYNFLPDLPSPLLPPDPPQGCFSPKMFQRAADALVCRQMLTKRYRSLKCVSCTLWWIFACSSPFLARFPHLLHPHAGHISGSC